MLSVELGSVVLWLFAGRLLPLIIRHGGGRGVSETAVFSCHLYRIASLGGGLCKKSQGRCSAAERGESFLALPGALNVNTPHKRSDSTGPTAECDNSWSKLLKHHPMQVAHRTQLTRQTNNAEKVPEKLLM